MASYHSAHWQPPDVSLGLPRSERVGGLYRAYIPDSLTGRPFAFGPKVSADIADAERALATLDATSGALTNTETLARLLLRAESVSSSQIEGLEIGSRRLMRADHQRAQGVPIHDETARAVLANIDAAEFAIGTIEAGGAITLEHLLETHRRLLAPTRLAGHAGQIRSQQNWIGGTSFSPLQASFVPPPVSELERLLDDLVTFCNDDDLPAISQAAIAHAQFETIHPFVDGNGRVGRALVQMILRRRGLAVRCTPPISLILATRATDYVAALQATRYDGPASGATANEAYDRWLSLFASSCVIAAGQALAFERTIAEIQTRWRASLGSVRSDSAAAKLLNRLPAMPVLTVRQAQLMTGKTFAAANTAVGRFVEAGILIQDSSRQRDRVYEARDIIDAFTNFERQLASPDLNTRISAPRRRVPYRKSSKKAKA